MTEIKEIIMTPEMAKTYLEANVSNRPLRRRRVMEYAKAMETGEWSSDVVDPICISVNGNLMNGQHRLMAIIMSNKSIPMYIQYGLPEDHYKYIDSGLPRNLADRINVVNRTNVASLTHPAYATEKGKARIVSAIQGKIASDRKTADRECDALLIDYIHSNYDKLNKAVLRGQKMRKAMGKGSLKAYAYCCWLIDWLGIGDKLDDFVDEFSKEISTDYNVQYVKNAMMKRMVQINGALTYPETVASILYAYDMYKCTKPIKNMNGLDKVLARYDALIKINRDKLNG